MTTCVRCGAELADGYACCRCGIDRPAAQLAEIRDMLSAARDVAHRLAVREHGAGASGKPGSTLPFDLGATSRLDAVQNALTTLARDIIETRGAQSGPTAEQVATHPDPLALAATWLTGHLEWLRHAVDSDHEPWAGRAMDEIEACARVVRAIARGPAAQRYLGPCGAPTMCDVSAFDEPPGSRLVEGAPCEGDVYARVHSDGTIVPTGTCRTCRATVDTAERQHWLDDQVREHNFRAADIAHAFGLHSGTIRTWHFRGLLIARGTDRDGRPLFNVGDTLDLARALAVRKAERQADRARRAAERAAQSEGAA